MTHVWLPLTVPPIPQKVRLVIYQWDQEITNDVSGRIRRHAPSGESLLLLIDVPSGITHYTLSRLAIAACLFFRALNKQGACCRHIVPFCIASSARGDESIGYGALSKEAFLACICLFSTAASIASGVYMKREEADHWRGTGRILHGSGAGKREVAWMIV